MLKIFKALKYIGLVILAPLILVVVILLLPFAAWNWLADILKRKELRKQIETKLINKGVNALVIYDGRDKNLHDYFKNHKPVPSTRVIDHTCKDKLLRELTEVYLADPENTMPIDQPLRHSKDIHHPRIILSIIKFMPKVKDDKRLDLLEQNYKPKDLNIALENLKREMQS